MEDCLNWNICKNQGIHRTSTTRGRPYPCCFFCGQFYLHNRFKMMPVVQMTQKQVNTYRIKLMTMYYDSETDEMKNNCVDSMKNLTRERINYLMSINHERGLSLLVGV